MDINSILIFIITFFVSLGMLFFLRGYMKADLQSIEYIRTMNRLTNEINRDIKKQILKHIARYLFAFIILIVMAKFAANEYAKIVFFGISSYYIALPMYIVFFILLYYLEKKKKK